MKKPSSNKNEVISNPKSMRFAGALFLLGSLILVYFWLQGFSSIAIEIPANGIGMSNLCDWQVSLSNNLVLSSNTNTPFLIFLHLSALLFLFRGSRKKLNFTLPLEFGILNILYVVVGTGIFFLLILLTILIYQIPGSDTWNMRLFGCEPTSTVLPGLFTITLVTAGLVISQATGWLQPRLAPKNPAVHQDEAPATRQTLTGKRLILWGGIILFLLTIALLSSWLVLFFTYAIQLPSSGIWSCWGTGCETTVWQSDLSRYFAFSSTARIKPFLLVIHAALIITLFRYRRKEDRVLLPLEFGTLAMLFMLLGTLVFAGTILVQKAAVPLQAPQPISRGEGGPLTGFMPVPPQGGFTVNDGTGFITMDADDELVLIFSRIPWEINGKVRAWAGVIASTFLTLGLLLSLATGWLNRILRRMTARRQSIFLSLILGITGSVFILEIFTFGFHLFR